MLVRLDVLERLTAVDLVVFDKTGTVSEDARCSRASRPSVRRLMV